MAISDFPTEAEAPGPHHRNIERLSIWGAVVLAVFVPIAWAWFLYRTGVCPGDVEMIATEVCRYSFFGPVALGSLVVLSFPLVIACLMLIGRERPDASPHTKAIDRIRHHTKTGYRSLGRPHRRHVRRTLLQATLVAGAIVGYLVFCYLDSPAFVGILLGFLPVASMFIVDRIWLREMPDERLA